MAPYEPQHLRDWLTDANLDGRYFWIQGADPLLRRYPGVYPPDPNYAGRHALAAPFDPPTDPDATLLTERLLPPNPLDPDQNLLTRAEAEAWVSQISREIVAGRAESGYPLGGAGRGHLQAAGYDYVRDDV